MIVRKTNDKVTDKWIDPFEVVYYIDGEFPYFNKISSGYSGTDKFYTIFFYYDQSVIQRMFPIHVMRWKVRNKKGKSENTERYEVTEA